MAGPIYFAIGDIHGEADKLAALHIAIRDRIAFENRAAVIVHLGDYVDRGPDSRRVIEQVMALERRFDNDPTIRVVSLMGNHELMMLDALDGDGSDRVYGDAWRASGGRSTIASYVDKRDDAVEWKGAIPPEHVTWLRSRPAMLYDPTRKLAFVHAGIDPSEFPDCSDEIRLWTRSDRFFVDANWPDREVLKGLTVVHGHTPTDDSRPEVTFRRINVDTGACFGGPLTAVMLKDGEVPSFLRAS
jgi:serine/threonine protein phosphatase 1